jgi:hypothetical protein
MIFWAPEDATHKVSKKFIYLLLREMVSVTYEQAIQGLFTAGTSAAPDP